MLVSQGLFPTSPYRPRVAISVDLLDFYHALSQRACDSITAVAGALKSFYSSRGFIHCDSKVGQHLSFRIRVLSKGRDK